MSVELIQGSDEWYAIRVGKVTASRIGDVMARTKTGWGAPRKHYMDRLVAERVTGKSMGYREVASLSRRLEMEPEARIAYEFYSGNQVSEVGFIDHPTIPYAGASPDGLIADDGGLEIKCCDTPQHIEMLLSGAIDKGYVYQCQFGMACTEREWWDFGSFDPTMPEELKLLIRRIARNEKLIDEIELGVIEFLAEVDAKVAQVQALMQGDSPLAVALEGSLAMTGGVNVI